MIFYFKLLRTIALPYILGSFAFLFVLGLSLSIALRRPYVANVPPLQLEPGESRYDGKVIIVGAGAAGMFAAYTLEYLKMDYVLLEANSEFGGRTLQMDDFINVPLDLGAEWIHVHPSILQDLLLFDNDQVTDEVITYQPQTISLIRNEKRRRTNWVRWFYSEHKFRNTTWWSYLNDYVYPHIAENLQRNAIVETIDYRQAGMVNVTTRDGRSFVGNRVIVATPVSVLQQHDVQFLPELSDEKRSALDKVYMTAGLKAWVEFEERFYRDLEMIWDAQDKLYMNAVFRKPTDRNVLALFEVGSSAYDRVELGDDDAILESILAELDQLFGGKASEHYVQHRIQNWSAEPFIKGAYSYNSYPIEPILQPVDGSIYFCGEYVAGTHQSTVHGAALSGRRVAEQVLLDWQAAAENSD